MVKKYDLVAVTREDIAKSGLGVGSEHFVAFACSKCKMAGIIDTSERPRVLYIPFRYLEVIDIAESEETRRYIDEIGDKHTLWRCNHD